MKREIKQVVLERKSFESESSSILKAVFAKPRIIMTMTKGRRRKLFQLYDPPQV